MCWKIVCLAAPCRFVPESPTLDRMNGRSSLVEEGRLERKVARKPEGLDAQTHYQRAGRDSVKPPPGGAVTRVTAAAGRLFQNLEAQLPAAECDRFLSADELEPCVPKCRLECGVSELAQHLDLGPNLVDILLIDVSERISHEELG